MQTYNNQSYTITNNLMTEQQLTNVTPDAYTKQRTRKSYELFKNIFFSLVEYYNKYCKHKNADDVNDLISEANDIDNIHSFINELPIASVDGSILNVSKCFVKDNLHTYNTQKCCTISISTILSNENKLPCSQYKKMMIKIMTKLVHF